jgi:hypothetical protein
MNWFNIILILVAQSVLFWYISQMYEKTSKFFNAFKSLFLVMALINIFVISLCLLFISSSDNYTNFNFFSNLFFGFQVLIFFIIIISYLLNYFLGAIDSAKKI